MSGEDWLDRFSSSDNCHYRRFALPHVATDKRDYRMSVSRNDNHGALTIRLHAGGKPASVSAGFGLGGGGCSVDSLNQKSSS
jgi:hypothetical protein